MMTSPDGGGEKERRYHRLGTQHPEAFEHRSPGMGVVAAGVRTEEVWGCPDCGALVWLRGNHDQWHTLNDAPLGDHIGRSADA